MNRRPRILAIVAALTLLLCPAVLRAEITPKAYRYLWLRQNLRAISGYTLAQIQPQLDTCRGRVVELGGQVAGISCLADREIIEGEQAVSFMLKTAQGETVFIECEAGIPEVALGRQVWVLARIPEAAQTIGTLELMEIAPASELTAEALGLTAAQVQVRQPAQAALWATPATPAASPGALPSRNANLSMAYGRLALTYNPDLTSDQAYLIGRKIVELSAKYGVARALIAALIKCESDFNPRAVSRAGAKGLGQLMPGTAAGLGVTDCFDIAQNLEGSVQYIATQLKRYTGRSNWEQFALGMSSYNAGPGAVKKYGGIPPYRETIAYVDRVAKYFREFDAWERSLLSGAGQ
jgi:soluble lytic murein transglycosylase-like protein